MNSLNLAEEMAMTGGQRHQKKKVPLEGTIFFAVHYGARRTSEGILIL
ncbi:hypothetical protein [Pararhizobium sp. A13]